MKFACVAALALASLCAVVRADAVADRAVAALVGAFVADAASMPLHWIYDVNQIKKMVGNNPPEFFYPPSCPYYNYTEGGQSIYGQQTSIYLNLLAQAGEVDPSALEQAYYNYYTSGPCKPTGGPNDCYRDGSTKGFLANEAQGLHWPNCGANDTQADAMPHSLPVVALMAGHKDLLKVVQTVISVTQNTDQARGFGSAAARIMEMAILNGTSGFDAVTAVAKELRNPNRAYPTPVDSQLADGLDLALANIHKPHIDFVLEVGQSCEWPYNLITGSQLLAQGASYVNATSQTLMAGGDECSRNMFVQSVNAALGGLNAIPVAWTQKTTLYNTVLAQAKQLVAKRKVF